MNDHLPKTRAEAQAMRSAKYFTGVPCKRGHVAPRYVDNSVCMTCRAEDVRVKRLEDRIARRTPLAEAEAPPDPRATLRALQADGTIRKVTAFVDARHPATADLVATAPRLLAARVPGLTVKPPAIVARADGLSRVTYYAHQDDEATLRALVRATTGGAE